MIALVKYCWTIVNSVLHSQYSKDKAQRQLNNRLLGIENKRAQKNVNGVHDQNIRRMHSLREKVMESPQPAVQATASAGAQKVPAPQAAPSPEVKKPRTAAAPPRTVKRPHTPSSPPPVAKAPDRPKKGLSFSFGAKASGSFKIGKGNVSQNLKNLISRMKR